MKKMITLLGAVLVLATSARAVEVAAPSALLMEKETGSILYAKDEHAKLEPASVTKVMTILLTMEAIDAGQLTYDTVVTASAHACSMGGSQIWLKENEQMTVGDMLKAVCVVSANDCAVALGEAVSGFLSGTYPVPVVRHGVADVFGRSGKAQKVLEHYRLTPEGVAERARAAAALKR